MGYARHRTGKQAHSPLRATGVLDKATYPVIVDPTFGYGRLEQPQARLRMASSGHSANHRHQKTVTINTISFYSSYSGSGTNCLLRPVLYQDSDLSARDLWRRKFLHTPAGTEEWKTLDITDAASREAQITIWVSGSISPRAAMDAGIATTPTPPIDSKAIPSLITPPIRRGPHCH